MPSQEIRGLDEPAADRALHSYPATASRSTLTAIVTRVLRSWVRAGALDLTGDESRVPVAGEDQEGVRERGERSRDRLAGTPAVPTRLAYNRAYVPTAPDP